MTLPELFTRAEEARKDHLTAQRELVKASSEWCAQNRTWGMRPEAIRLIVTKERPL